MASWGRKETVIWPPHAPIYTYSAVCLALLLTCFFGWERFHFSESTLQQSYTGAYVRSLVGTLFKQHGKYQLIYLSGGKLAPRLALPVDFEPGTTTLPNGNTIPVALSSFATALGYKSFYRGPERIYEDASMSRWLRDVIFGGKGMLETYAISLGEGAFVLALLLAYAVPRDVKRFKELKYGRRLRGPEMLTPKEFNRVLKGDGIGFKISKMKKMVCVPAHSEAQHFQIFGDTGAGKTQLISQILRQIRGREDTAIVYDPAREYIQRFYDAKRGDIVLNPLDARCPYWGPADELRFNAEADAIAASLYQPTTDQKDEFFHETPAQIFAHLLKMGPTPHELAAWMASAKEIESRVKGTEMEHYIGEKAGPQRMGVLSSLGLVAKSLRILPTLEQTGGNVWTATEWAEHRQGWIFITSRPAERVTLRPLHSLWIDLLVMRLMTTPMQGQKKVWFVIDELASLQRLPQLHTAITENRKSQNPLVLGLQGKSQAETIYGHLAEVMLSQAATKIFLRTSEPNASEWISKGIGKVEIERLKETKFDGSRSGKNFTLDRQIEPLVMDSEIQGLPDKHAYLKLGNYVTQFEFDYLDLPKYTPEFLPRKIDGDRLIFSPKTMRPQIQKPEPAPQVSASAEAEATLPREEEAAEAEAGNRPVSLPVSAPVQLSFDQLLPQQEDEEVAAIPTEATAIAAHPDEGVNDDEYEDEDQQAQIENSLVEGVY